MPATARHQRERAPDEDGSVPQSLKRTLGTKASMRTSWIAMLVGANVEGCTLKRRNSIFNPTRAKLSSHRCSRARVSRQNHRSDRAPLGSGYSVFSLHFRSKEKFI